MLTRLARSPFSQLVVAVLAGLLPGLGCAVGSDPSPGDETAVGSFENTGDKADEPGAVATWEATRGDGYARVGGLDADGNVKFDTLVYEGPTIRLVVNEPRSCEAEIDPNTATFVTSSCDMGELQQLAQGLMQSAGGGEGKSDVLDWTIEHPYLTIAIVVGSLVVIAVAAAYLAPAGAGAAALGAAGGADVTGTIGVGLNVATGKVGVIYQIGSGFGIGIGL